MKGATTETQALRRQAAQGFGAAGHVPNGHLLPSSLDPWCSRGPRLPSNPAEQIVTAHTTCLHRTRKFEQEAKVPECRL
ncbi:hypothetical protein SRHO_G00324900 [Serrasalmus rhombeus]